MRMDNSVNRALSFFFNYEKNPIINPIKPIIAINGVGMGTLIISKLISFKAINVIKTKVKLFAHLPIFVRDQN